MQVIYLDTLFFINLCINYVLLMLTSEFAGVYAGRLRIVLGAAFGALFAVVCFFCDTGLILSLAMKVLLCVAIILITFKYEHKGKLLRLCAIFFVISVSLGGVVVAISFASVGGMMVVKNGVPYFNISFRVLIVAAAISYGMLTLVYGSGGMKASKQIRKVDISLGNRHVRVKTLVDTGNLLRDPITGRQVIIVEKSSVVALLEQIEADILDGLTCENTVSCYEQLCTANMLRYGLLSYCGVNKSAEIMLTVKPDSITIDGEKCERYLIGVVAREMNAACGCSAIIGV